jgi:hypothetical protein
MLLTSANRMGRFIASIPVISTKPSECAEIHSNQEIADNLFTIEGRANQQQAAHSIESPDFQGKPHIRQGSWSLLLKTTLSAFTDKRIDEQFKKSAKNCVAEHKLGGIHKF